MPGGLIVEEEEAPDHEEAPAQVEAADQEEDPTQEEALTEERDEDQLANCPPVLEAADMKAAVEECTEEGRQDARCESALSVTFDENLEKIIDSKHDIAENGIEA
jgi:hypothetical protein